MAKTFLNATLKNIMSSVIHLFQVYNRNNSNALNLMKGMFPLQIVSVVIYTIDGEVKYRE